MKNMSKYYDDNHICDHQQSGLVNLLTDDNYFDDIHSGSSLLESTDTPPATFCVRCRSLSNSSTMNGEWDSNSDHGHNITSHDFQPGMQSHHLLRNAGDGADIPLLSNSDGFVNTACNSIHHGDLDHCHTMLPSPQNSSAVKQLLAAMAMCLIFMIAEVIGGYLAGSLAVMTDAAHLTSDFVGFLVSLFAIHLGKRPPNKRLTFGYHRAEVLGALLSVSIIWMLTAIFICLAVQRVIHRDFHIDADTMMIVAAIGIIINIVMGLVLHGVCHGISHGHSHGHSTTVNERWSETTITTNHSHKKHQNINVRAAVIHVVGDLIQSIGVFIAAIVIKYYPNAELVDPVCTLIFSLLALTTTAPVLKDSVLVLMEAFPRSHDYSSMARFLRSIEGVRTIHNLHVWCLTINTNALSVHLAIDASADPESVLKQALILVRNQFDIYNATIQVEKYTEDSMRHCLQCQPPGD